MSVDDTRVPILRRYTSDREATLTAMIEDIYQNTTRINDAKDQAINSALFDLLRAYMQGIAAMPQIPRVMASYLTGSSGTATGAYFTIPPGQLIEVQAISGYHNDGVARNGVICIRDGVNRLEVSTTQNVITNQVVIMDAADRLLLFGDGTIQIGIFGDTLAGAALWHRTVCYSRLL